MSLATSMPIRFSLMLLISALLVSGCSDSNNVGSQSPTDVSGANGVGVTSDEGTDGGASEMGAVDTGNDAASQTAIDLTGTNNPVGDDLPQPVQASFELVPDKTFRISWQSSTGAQFYRVLENADGISGFTDISGELNATTTNFDYRVALFARVNARYLVQSCNDQGCVDSDAVMVTGTLDNAIGYVKSSNADSVGGFGRSVSLSADGKTFAVSVNTTDYSGAVYVFVQSGGQWQQQAYLKASNAEARDGFGWDVNLSADGNTLAVAAPNENSAAIGVNGDQSDNSADRAGAVYVFARSGGQWQQQAYLKASNTETDDFFGGALSLSADGNTLAIAAWNESSAATGINGNQSDNSASREGAVYVFAQSGGQWQQQAYLKSSIPNRGDTGSGSVFGGDLSLSSDGSVLAVKDRGEGSGLAVNFFARSGGQWQQQAYLNGGDRGESGSFGGALSLSADGNTLAVGATSDGSAATGINGDPVATAITGSQSDNSAPASGAAYVFVQSGGQWQQQAYIKASNTDAQDSFGWELSLSADGNTLAASANYEYSAATGINGDQNDNSRRDAGAVYVFVRNAGQWQQQAYVKATNPDPEDNFGTFLSLSGDGNTLAVSAPRERSAATGFNGDQTDNSARDSGAVYLF